jgi:hypothetical protein
MPSHLSCSHTHTSRSSIPRSIIVRLPRLSPSRVSQRNPTLLLVTSLCSFCLEDKRYSHDRDGGETKNKSIIINSSIQSPLRPDAEIGIKSHNNNSVRTTRLSASSRICFRALLLPLCFSLDPSTRRRAFRFFRIRHVPDGDVCVSSGPRPSRIWAVLCPAARLSIDHPYLGRFKC